MKVDFEHTNILVAEDDDDDFYFFSASLEQVTETVVLTRAENGDILMAMLKEAVPDILFLDIEMPHKDGRICLREIRSDKRYDFLPVIMFSDHDDFRTVEFCYQEKSNGFAVKPTSITGMVKIIREILSSNLGKKPDARPRNSFVISS